jgi:hypothetical protein
VVSPTGAPHLRPTVAPNWRAALASYGCPQLARRTCVLRLPNGVLSPTVWERPGQLAGQPTSSHGPVRSGRAGAASRRGRLRHEEEASAPWRCRALAWPRGAEARSATWWYDPVMARAVGVVPGLLWVLSFGAAACNFEWESAYAARYRGQVSGAATSDVGSAGVANGGTALTNGGTS